MVIEMVRVLEVVIEGRCSESFGSCNGSGNGVAMSFVWFFKNMWARKNKREKEKKE